MINRRQVLVGTAATVTATVLASGRGEAQSGATFKFGHALPPAHPFSIGVQSAADRTGADTEGRLKVQVFGGSTLGGDADMLSQLRSGAIDMYALSPLVLSTLIPVASISGMPFAFRDYAEVWNAVDGDLGQLVRDGAEGAGLKVVGGLWDTGFRQFVTNVKPINAPEDLSGFKIRVPPSPLWLSMMQAFSAAPAGISYAEVYSSLQTGVVDGFENNLVGIEAGKFYEVLKYLSMANYMWDGMIVLANKRALERISAEDQAKLFANYDDEAKKERAVCEKLNVELLEKLKGHGLTVSEPDREAFKAALQKADFYATWRDKYGADAWAVLEKYAGKLA